ncbi:MAG: N-6 DNA methylase [Bacteroidota bacterium]|jgi:23S rRNA G2445 N2-methylase RlmL
MNTHNITNTLNPFIDAFKSIGFQKEQIKERYEFVDLLGQAQTRTVDLGVFGREPLDYKSACFGIHLLREGGDEFETAKSLCSFGASQLFIVLNGSTQRWFNSSSKPKLVQSLPTTDVPNLIRSNSIVWNPDYMMKVRSGLELPKPEQIDFVDVDLIPALEKEASVKIDSLIKRALYKVEINRKKHRISLSEENVYRTLFRLLTAKLLSDRGVPVNGEIDFSKPLDTLKSVSNFYGMTNQNFNKPFNHLLAEISGIVGDSFSFKNLSVDTLTYVYENTLVTEAKRKEYGIHSTPAYLADFIIANLPLDGIPLRNLNVIDPMCGHAIFLIAAMRRLRELLPPQLDGKHRHEYFADHLHGIEIDSFACEVARMCLTLADFPQPDGWDIHKHDVFQGDILNKAIQQSTVVVGNPPFETIPNVSPKTSKAKELLRQVLPKMPKDGIIGIVLPKSFLTGKDYKVERNYLLDKFTILNVTELPERVFTHATVETCVITAKKSKTEAKAKYFMVDRPSLELFKSKYFIPCKDEVKQDYFTTTQQGQIFVPVMRGVWDYLKTNPRFESLANVHKGVEYELRLISEHRESVIKSRPFQNSQPGLWNIPTDQFQFVIGTGEYFSLDKRYWRNQNSKAWRLPWKTPKIIVPQSRDSSSHWRFAAVIDKEGLIVGRNLYAIWPKTNSVSMEFLCALLNSPVGQAYCLAHGYQQLTRGRDYESIPIPRSIPYPTTLIDGLVNSYLTLSKNEQYNAARDALLQIDAEILKLYELPPKLERGLLDFFWGHKRRVPFDFQGYIPPTFDSWIPLHIYISKDYKEATIADTLRRLPSITDKDTIKYLEELGHE